MSREYPLPETLTAPGSPDATTVAPVKSVPTLVPRKKRGLLKAAGALFPGAKTTTNQIVPYTEWWSTQNQGAVKGDGRLLVAIGDSLCIGIGASHPSKSLVGQIAELLTIREGTPWRVVNLAIAGARMDDGLERQLPITLSLLPADLVLCCIGSNDIVWTPAVASVRNGLRKISAALPETTVFGPVAGASGRARLSNRALRQAAAENDQVVADIWNVDGPKLSERTAPDRFHPNDLGYELMAREVVDTWNDRRP